MRAACAVIAITALLGTNVLADAGTLAPGRPAGTVEAQTISTIGTVVLSGIGVLGILLATQSGGAQKLTPDSPVASAAAATGTVATTTTTR